MHFYLILNFLVTPSLYKLLILLLNIYKSDCLHPDYVQTSFKLHSDN